MQIRKILNATLARLFLPQSDLSGVPVAGEIGVSGDALRFRNTGDTATRRVLTDAEVGVANGVAPLDSNGLIPASLLPASSSASSAQMPIGVPYPWLGDPLAIPSDALLLNGAEYLRADYPALFNQYRTRFGRASSDLHFRVPDLVGRTLYGVKAGAEVYGSVGNPVRVHRVNIVNRGYGFTPGTYSVVVTGGAFVLLSTVEVIVNAGGEVETINVVSGGSYTAIGAAITPSNCALIIGTSTLGAGSGFTYDFAFLPLSSPTRAYSIRLTERGVGGTSAPKVTIGGAVGATAIAIMDESGGTVREVVLTNPGVGSPTTVTFTGGGFSTPPTAAVVLIRPPLSVGDQCGEEMHTQIVKEVGPHTHDVVCSTSANYGAYVDEGDNTGGGIYVTEPNVGGLAFNTRAPGMGVIWIARAA